MSDATNKNTMRGTAQKGMWVAIALLAILLLLSLILLTVRLYDFVNIDERAVSLKTNMHSDLDIFSITYKNASGDIVVDGQNGEKVIAPGVHIDYTVRLHNVDDVAIDYMIRPKVEFTSEYKLPILVRILDTEMNYLVGDQKTWVKIEELNNAKIDSTLGEDKTAEYIFQWKWAFESGNDEFDSMLGSEAVNKDIGLTVDFSVTALTNTNFVEKGGIFGDGALSTAVTYTFIPLLIAALVLLIVMLVKSGKKKAAEDIGDGVADAVDTVISDSDT